MDDLVLENGLCIPLAEIRFETSRAGGPGGQHVNKTESRVTLRFSVADAECLPADVRQRLLARLAARLTTAGELVIHAAEHRQQVRNKEEALQRLAGLLNDALRRQKSRRKTRPTRGSIERRISESKRRGHIKRMRRRPRDEE